MTADCVPHRLVCQRVVHALMEQYGWALVSEDELLERVANSTLPGASELQLRNEAVHQYTLVSYHACRQSSDPRLRERSYEELHRFIYRQACRRHPDVAAEAAEEACSLVFRQIERCQRPDTFLAFALLKLWQSASAIRRDRSRRSDELSIEDCGVVADEDTPTRSPLKVQAPNHSEPAPQLLGKECKQVILEAIRRLPGQCRAAAAMKFLAGLSHEEIGSRLGASDGNVRQLLFRARDKLRQDEQVRTYFPELGRAHGNTRHQGGFSRNNSPSAGSFRSDGNVQEANEHGESGTHSGLPGCR